MDWFSKYYPQRTKYWPAIEQFFGNLPPTLHRRATLLKNDLAIACSDTGQFADILSRRPDHPLLYLPFWLQDDWQQRDDSLAQHLLPAQVFAFAGLWLQQAIGNESSGFDLPDTALAQLLLQQANFELTQYFPADSPFWPHARACWLESAEAALAGSAARWWAFAKISVAAVAVAANRQPDLPRLFLLLDDFNAVYQSQLDVFSLRRDLTAGRVTPPIRQIMAAAGIDPQQPAAPERILGAAVLTGAVTRLCETDATRLEGCRLAAAALGLPTLAGYLAAAAEYVRDTGQLFSLKPKTVSPPRVFVPPFDALATALDAAEGYLLSDLTFRESWDVQRGAGPQLTARAFPVGLVLEILSRTGHSLPAQVAEVFAQLHASGYRYYDLPQLPPDADDLGLLLRLFRYLPDETRPAVRRQLAAPLRQMSASILPAGEIPVWFQAEAAGNAGPLVWGHSCATTEINLLLGLIDFDWLAYRQTVTASARSIFQRFASHGLGASLYYVTPYVLWSVFELMAQLRRRSVEAELGRLMTQAEAQFLERFERETQQPDISAQSAAFFLLTSSEPRTRWRDLLQKSQRPDGSWPAEALFLTPHRHRTAWYASRTVTTAICYFALWKFGRDRAD